jgi:hypothetical protein
MDGEVGIKSRSFQIELKNSDDETLVIQGLEFVID